MGACWFAWVWQTGSTNPTYKMHLWETTVDKPKFDEILEPDIPMEPDRSRVSRPLQDLNLFKYPSAPIRFHVTLHNKALVTH